MSWGLVGVLTAALAVAAEHEWSIHPPQYTRAMLKVELDKAYEMGALERRAYKAALARIGEHDVPLKKVNITRQGPLPEYVNAKLYRHVEKLRATYAKTSSIPSKSRRRVAERLHKPKAVAILVGDSLEHRTGSDTEILFRQESNFIYATGFDHPGAKVVIGLDPNHPILPAGDAWLFVPKRDPVWAGLEETLDNYLQKYDVNNVSWASDFNTVVDTILQPETIFTFAGADIWGSASPPPCAERADHDQTKLRDVFAEARVVKLPEELEMIRAATHIAVEEHKTIMRHISCGMWESDAESLFRFVGHNYGARFQSYRPIVGSGPNSAALHYSDNDAIIPEASLILVDAAAELGQTRNGGGYTSDVTRTWPCSGKYTKEQRNVYGAVYAAQQKCIEHSVVGGSMSAASEASARAMLEKLRDVGILQGSIDGMFAARIHSLFQPHGLGHSVGLDVHDPGNLNPFKPGTVITCEPGCYFYPSLLDPAYDNPDQGKYLNKRLIEEKYIHMGGVRIEDVVYIAASGPELLSGSLPRTADSVEAFMAQLREPK